MIRIHWREWPAYIAWRVRKFVKSLKLGVKYE